MNTILAARASLWAAIKEHVDAQTEWANHGCQPPQDWPAYEADAKDAQRDLEEMIKTFEDKVIESYKQSQEG